MRTIAIVFALTVVGGAAPTAPYDRGYLSIAVLVLAAALVALLATCLVSGWLLWELRTFMRMARYGPAGMPAPFLQPALWPARSLPSAVPDGSPLAPHKRALPDQG